MHAKPSHWLHEICMFQNCSSPLLAWAHYNLRVLIYWRNECLPLLLVYIGVKWKNFGQNIWDKKCGAIGNILGKPLGTLWEHVVFSTTFYG